METWDMASQAALLMRLSCAKHAALQPVTRSVSMKQSPAKKEAIEGSTAHSGHGFDRRFRSPRSAHLGMVVLSRTWKRPSQGLAQCSESRREHGTTGPLPVTLGLLRRQLKEQNLPGGI